MCLSFSYDSKTLCILHIRFVSRSVIAVAIEWSADLFSLGGECMTMCIVHNTWYISKCGGMFNESWHILSPRLIELT